MTKYILAGGTLVLAVAIPRFVPAASTIQPVSTAVRTPGAGGERSPLVVASSRDLTSMLVAPRDDGSNSGMTVTTTAVTTGVIDEGASLAPA